MTGLLRGDLVDADRAKLLSTLAYTLASLSWVSLRASGSNVSAHPVKQEIERVKAYMSRVGKLSDSLQVQDHPSIKLDKDAAHRIITHNVGSKRGASLV